MSSQPPSEATLSAFTRRTRKYLACSQCRKRKSRCKPADDSTDAACERCVKYGLVCEYLPVATERERSLFAGDGSPATHGHAPTPSSSTRDPTQAAHSSGGYGAPGPMNYGHGPYPAPPHAAYPHPQTPQFHSSSNNFQPHTAPPPSAQYPSNSVPPQFRPPSHGSPAHPHNYGMAGYTSSPQPSFGSPQQQTSQYHGQPMLDSFSLNSALTPRYGCALSLPTWAMPVRAATMKASAE
ncbi:hypothetical protein C8R46DRAFT_1262112 [Mycena filopes]|nr:hypothetical protein C8R46DRAFT_1262112 [Mycena filopes]